MVDSGRSAVGSALGTSPRLRTSESPGPRRSRTACTAAALLATIVAAALPAHAQAPDPRLDWRTIATPNFRVHYSDGLEAEARRAAANAEWAWTALARELVPPRGPVDLVVADNVDFTQGYASWFPSNRIVIFPRPPVEQFAFRYHDDWSRLVIAHELTHLFHLDRARGVWGALQRVFGRNPALFPNAYGPAWVTEGLAVYYESRLTGTGRVAGVEHRLVARAAAAEGHVPRLDQLSQASSVFPGASQAYAYGSLVFDHLARTRGAEHVATFVERQAAQLVPFRLDRAARRSFGVTFTDAWDAWRDSVRAAADGATRGAGGAWRALTDDGWYAAYPRWADPATVVYGANTGRSVSAAYRVDTAGRRRLLGRRNTLAPNVVLPDGRVLFSQLEYVDRYTIRSDLWVQRDATRPSGPIPGFGAAAGGQTRLTRGARLAHPDARADGEIAAVRYAAGTTALVRVSRDGARVAPLTRATPDSQWTEPRWSPDGRHLVAVVLTAGARSAVVVLDTVGTVVRVVGDERAVSVAPSWSADGRRVLWASDRTGEPQLHAADVRLDDPDAPVRVPAAAVERLTGVPTGVLQASPSPDGRTLAAVVYRGDGYRVAAADPAALRPTAATADTSVYLAAAAIPAPAVPPDALVARAYAPWRTLAPRYWMPVAVASAGEHTLLGASTSGSDVLGRHAFAAQAAMRVRRGDAEWSGSYRYGRFGQPTIDLGAAQAWQYDTVVVALPAGLDTAPLFRRTRQAALTFGLLRPRYRTGASLTLAAEVERRAYESPLPAVVALAGDRLGRTFPALSLGAAWSNTRRPVRAVSLEDGVALSASVRHRWQDGRLGPTSRRAVGTARAFKSLDLPGFAHHVVALRVAGGVADRRSASEFEAGGTSGSLAEVVPGVTIGDPARTFGVRGFAPGAQVGLHAAAASLEYRAPVAIAARGLRLLPVFLDRLSFVAFADAGSAWCPPGIDRRVQTLCRTSTSVTPERPRWLASVGGEVGLDAAIAYDAPLRFRLGVAAPVAGRDRAPRAVSPYLSVGTAF